MSPSAVVLAHAAVPAFGSGVGDFTATFPRSYFPYFAQGEGTTITITKMELYIWRGHQQAP
jgi:hypothetical protein